MIKKLKIIYILIFIINIIFCSRTFSQIYENELPKFIDIFVNNIYLSDSISVNKILGSNIDLHITENEETRSLIFFPHACYVNNDTTELLLLIKQPGTRCWGFEEFEVMKFPKEIKEKYKLLKNTDVFITSRKIHLGMSAKELLTILGSCSKKEEKNGLVTYYYNFNDFENSRFLKYYNMPSYSGIYKFQNDKLMNFRFGFDYP